jgi:phage terminase large subunit
MTIRIGKPFEFLFEKSRGKVAYGGRGSGKSVSFARALLVQGAASPLKILCARETQTSINESVYDLLRTQIGECDLESFYEVLSSEIRGKNGTRFVFAGLRQQGIANIKSFNDVDRCWVEEAQVVSKRSWDVLLPTIRKSGSEIWCSMNPELDTDETYLRFIQTPPDGWIVKRVNYDENEWFTEELEAERLDTLKRDPAGYKNIWEGNPRAAVDGAIYADEVAKSYELGRVRNIPHDPQLRTHVVFDLGFNDSMAIILVQKVASEIRIIHHIEDSQRTLASYSQELKTLDFGGEPINWGSVYLPHDGFAVRHQSGIDDASVMRGLGWTIAQTPNTSVESGINRSREMFSRVYFDAERCDRLLQCLKRYRRHISNSTGAIGSPIHDEYSHSADAFRYLALNEQNLTNEEWGGQKMNYPRLNYA